MRMIANHQSMDLAFNVNVNAYVYRKYTVAMLGVGICKQQKESKQTSKYKQINRPTISFIYFSYSIEIFSGLFLGILHKNRRKNNSQCPDVEIEEVHKWQ